MTNIKYSKRFKLRNGERVDFCPEKENLMAINAPTNLLTICQRKKNVIKDIG